MLLIVAMIGFGVGVSYGVDQTVSYGIKVVFALMEKQKIQIDIDENMIKKGLFQYKSNINGCLFTE